MKCGFCYDSEQGKYGEVKREWSWDWNMFIPVCRKHFAQFRTFEAVKAERALRSIKEGEESDHEAATNP